MDTKHFYQERGRELCVCNCKVRIITSKIVWVFVTSEDGSLAIRNIDDHVC